MFMTAMKIRNEPRIAMANMRNSLNGFYIIVRRLEGARQEGVI
jgi:hypothetical protein